MSTSPSRARIERRDFLRAGALAALATTVDLSLGESRPSASSLPSELPRPFQQNAFELEEATIATLQDGMFVVDATGPRGFLHQKLELGERDLPDFPRTQALYSHFTEVKRLDDRATDPREIPPYPVDDAAVHHEKTSFATGFPLGATTCWLIAAP